MRVGISLGALAALQLVVGLVGQLAVMRIVGIGRDTDSYIAAQALPLVLTGVMTTSLQNVWLPRFARLSRRSEPDALSRLHAAALGQGLRMMVPLTLLLWGSSFMWVRWVFPGFDGEQHRQVIALSGPLLLACVFTAQSGLLTAALRAEGLFVRAEVTTLVTGLAGIALIIALVPVFGVAAATWIVLTRAIATHAVHLWQAGRPGLDLRTGAESREVWRLVRPMLAGGMLIKTGPLVDRFWSSKAPDGGMTLLNLAQLCANALVAVLERAVLVPATPEFSRRLGAGDTTGLRATYRRCLVRIAFGTVVIGAVALLMMPVWTWLLGVALRIDEDAARTVFAAGLLLVPSIFAAVGASTASAVLYAFGDTRTATIIGVTGFAASLVLKGVLFSLFGILGLAAGVSVYVLLVQAAYHVAASRRIRQAMRQPPQTP